MDIKICCSRCGERSRLVPVVAHDSVIHFICPEHFPIPAFRELWGIEYKPITIPEAYQRLIDADKSGKAIALYGKNINNISCLSFGMKGGIKHNFFHNHQGYHALEPVLDAVVRCSGSNFPSLGKGVARLALKMVIAYCFVRLVIFFM